MPPRSSGDGPPAPAPAPGPARTVAGFAEFVDAWNGAQDLTTPELHLEICRWLEARLAAGDRELLLMAFRGGGKSTLVGLFAAWLLLGDPNRRVLVLAADHALARKMTRNVKRIIERHALTADLRPPRGDEWAADRFTVARKAELRDPSMLAKGIGANVTGSRADVVICDDVEVPDTSDTPGKREDLRQRLDEIDFVLVPGGLKLFVGTPHAYCSIYADVPRAEADEERPYLDGFARLALPVFDDAGRSRWPERFPPEKIEATRRRSGPTKFASQMLLRFVSPLEVRLDPGKLKVYDHEIDYREGNGEATLRLGGLKMESAIGSWDPAYGAPRKGDANAFAAVFCDAFGGYWLHRLEYLAHDPTLEEPATTQLCRQVARLARELYLPAVRIETNGLGKFLPEWLRREIKLLGVRCAVIEDHSSRPKDERILAAFDALLAGEKLHAHRSVLASRFATEMREWRPGGGGRDDGLDAAAAALLREPVRLPRLAPATPELPAREWRPGARPVRAETEFEI